MTPGKKYDSLGVELTLPEMMAELKKNYKLMLVVFIFTLSPFVVYTIYADRIYRAEAYFLPPLEQDIQELNILEMAGKKTNFQIHTPDSVYTEFLTKLKSRAILREFYISENIYDHYLGIQRWSSEYEAFVEGFFNDIQLDIPNEEDVTFVGITYELNRADIAQEWLAKFITMVNDRVIADLSTGVESGLRTRISRLRSEIAGKRKLAQLRRSDRILVLQEASNIATELGLENGSKGVQLGIDKSTSGLSVNTAETPLYLRGSIALLAEMNALRSRASDDPFIPGLRDLQEQLAALENIKIRRENIHPAILDQKPSAIDKPIRPVTEFIIAGGVVFALFLTMISLFIVTSFHRNKNCVET